MYRNVIRSITFVAAVSFILVCAPVARSAEFTAEVTVERNGVKHEGTAYVKGGSVRYEIETASGPEVVIFRADIGAQWRCYPGKGAYTELWDHFSGDFLMPEATPLLRESAGYEMLGTDTVEGLACEIHYYRYDDHARGTLTVWYARGIGYPVRIELKTRYGCLTKEYRNIRTTRIDDWLFELPEGYTMIE